MSYNSGRLIGLLNGELAAARTANEGSTDTARITLIVSVIDLVKFAANAQRMADEMGNAATEMDGDVAYMQGGAHMLAASHKYVTGLWENIALRMVDVYSAPF